MVRISAIAVSPWHCLSVAILLVAFGGLVGCDGGGDNVSGPEPPSSEVDDSVVVDLSEQHQVIRGFGGATVFRLNNPLSEEDMDRIFGNGEGELGFTIHRIRVVPDENSFGRTVELQHARGAKERGAKVIAAPWSPPARMKTNNDLVGGSLKRDSFAVYAGYLNDFAREMEENGAELYGISIQNEPDIEVGYESCEWTSSEMEAFLRDHGDKITETRVMAPESYRFDHSFSDPILRDSAAASNLDIVAGHLYGGGLEPYPLARDIGKELWMTEHLDTMTTWQANLATGKEIHDSMADANFNAYLWWYVKRFYGPLNESGQISKRGYVMAQYSKFVRPGYHRVEATENPGSSDIHVSAYNGDKTVIVAINMQGVPARIRFKLQDGEVSEVDSYRTTETSNLSLVETISLSDGSFKHSLPAMSITTFEEN